MNQSKSVGRPCDMTSKRLENCRAVGGDQSEVNGDKLVMEIAYPRKLVYRNSTEKRGWQLTRFAGDTVAAVWKCCHVVSVTD